MSIVGEKVQRILNLNYNLPILLLIYIFITLPFAVEGFNKYFMFLNKIIFIFIGVFSFYKYCNMRNYKIEINFYLIYIFIFIFILYTYLISVFYYDRLFINTIKELILFICLIFSIIFINTFKFSINYVKIINYVLIFFSLDVIIQFGFGTDLFGFKNYFNERYWGVFHYGAPTFGVFISLFFFVPLFLYKSKIKLFLIYSIFIISLFLSNDRAAILILIFSYILFSLVKGYKSLIVSTIFVILIFVIFTVFKDIFPYRIQMLIELIYQFFKNGIYISENVYKENSVFAYLNIWITNFNIWFRIENILYIIFGSGFGNLQAYFIYHGGYDRTHNMLLEIIMTFGLFGSFIIFNIFRKLITFSKPESLIVITHFSPFLFFSLYSANQIILFLISFFIYKNLIRGYP